MVRRGLTGLWIIGCAAVLIGYYPKLGHLIAAGPAAWWRLDLTDGHLGDLRSHPALGEAAGRAGRGLLGAVLVIMAAHALGVALCAVIRWHGDDWQERLLFRMGAGFFVLSEASIALAALHLYRRPVVAGFVLVAAAADVLVLARARPPDLRASMKHGARRLFLSRRDIGWKVIVALALLIALIGALAPEREFDALWFHLDFPRQWLKTGHLIQPASEYVSLYPMSWETVYGAGLALGGQVAAKLVHFACLPLTALIVHQATRRYFPRAKPWLAVALLVTAPTLLWEATTAYVDLSGAFLVALAGYALLRYSETRSRPWLIMAGINIGMAVASKHLALLALCLLAVLLVIGLRRAGASIGNAMRSAGLLFGIGLAAALPWYVHSWVASGNPVLPEAYGIFGSPADRWNAAADEGLRAFGSRFGVTRSPLHLLTLPWTMTVHGARFGGTFGPLFLMLLPALLFLRGRPTRWFLAFAVGYLVLWASPISTFQMRWAIPAVPVMAVLGAEAASRVHRHARQSVRLGAIASALFSGGIAVIMLLNLPPLTAYQEADRHGDREWLTHVMHKPPLPVVLGAESARDYLARVVPSSEAWRYIDRHTPVQATVLAFTDGGDNFLTHRARLPYDSVLAQPAVGNAPVGREREALNALRRLRVTYILFDEQLVDRINPSSAITSPRAMACWYDIDYDDGRFVVARLRWSARLVTYPWFNCGRPQR